MTTREVGKIVTGTYQIDGAGVKLVRVIGHKDTKDFDPFLMLNSFDSYNPADYLNGFPSHPHRGIETVTYLIEGSIDHGDSFGNKGSILAGECQWMTAGSGIIHQEMPQPCTRLLGFQLWLNMPAQDKMTTPQYRNISAEMIPKAREDGNTIGIISGSYHEILGAVQEDSVQTLLLDVDLAPYSEWELCAAPEETLFVYVVKGSGYFGTNRENAIDQHKAVLFTPGDQFSACALGSGVRFMLFSGCPLKEPIAWDGSIVMNTQKELRQAFEEIHSGTFVTENAVKEEPQPVEEESPSEEDESSDAEDSSDASDDTSCNLPVSEV